MAVLKFCYGHSAIQIIRSKFRKELQDHNILVIFEVAIRTPASQDL